MDFWTRLPRLGPTSFLNQGTFGWEATAHIVRASYGAESPKAAALRLILREPVVSCAGC